MRFGTDELGKYEIGTDGLVYLRLVKPSCASPEVAPFGGNSADTGAGKFLLVSMGG